MYWTWSTNQHNIRDGGPSTQSHTILFRVGHHTDFSSAVHTVEKKKISNDNKKNGTKIQIRYIARHCRDLIFLNAKLIDLFLIYSVTYLYAWQIRNIKSIWYLEGINLHSHQSMIQTKVKGIAFSYQTELVHMHICVNTTAASICQLSDTIEQFFIIHNTLHNWHFSSVISFNGSNRHDLRSPPSFSRIS